MKTQVGSMWPVVAVAVFVVYVLGVAACDRLIGRRNGIQDVNEYWPQNWPVLGSWVTLVILLRQPHLTPRLRQPVK